MVSFMSMRMAMSLSSIMKEGEKMKYRFNAPRFLDEEQAKYLEKCGIATIKGKDIVFIYDPAMARHLSGKSKQV
jgi:hypothetical protein